MIIEISTRFWVCAKNRNFGYLMDKGVAPLHFANPRAQYVSMKESIDTAISKVLNSENYILGTEVAIVGILASCQPIPVLIILTPAASNDLANSTTSSHVEPLSTKSNIDKRKTIMKSLPTLSRIAFTIANGNFTLF